jgi:hypothetical protein
VREEPADSTRPHHVFHREHGCRKKSLQSNPKVGSNARAVDWQSSVRESEEPSLQLLTRNEPSKRVASRRLAVGRVAGIERLGMVGSSVDNRVVTQEKRRRATAT